MDDIAFSASVDGGDIPRNSRLCGRHIICMFIGGLALGLGQAQADVHV